MLLHLTQPQTFTISIDGKMLSGLSSDDIRTMISSKKIVRNTPSLCAETNKWVRLADYEGLFQKESFISTIPPEVLDRVILTRASTPVFFKSCIIKCTLASIMFPPTGVFAFFFSAKANHYFDGHTSVFEAESYNESAQHWANLSFFFFVITMFGFFLFSPNGKDLRVSLYDQIQAQCRNSFLESTSLH